MTTIIDGSPSQQVQNQPSVNQRQVKSYANVTQPKKEQAIIIDSMEGFTNDDYIDGLEKIVSVTSIVSIS